MFHAPALGEWAAATFGLAVTSCRFHRSFVNDTYVLEADRRYYLRVSQAGWRDRDEVAGELATVEALHRAGADVARPVPRRDGEGFVAEVEAPEGRRPVVLFHEAAGAELGYWGVDGAENSRRYGDAVARLHAAAVGLGPPRGRPPMGVCALVDAPIATVARRLESTDRAFLDALAVRLREHLSAPDLTVGLCHGDLNTTNVHFTEDRATAFDFDCCHWGWVPNDIAGFARGITLGRTPGEPVSRLLRSFLAGYEAIRPIPAADRVSLPAFLLAQRIWMASIHLEGEHRWGAWHFGPAYAHRLVVWLRDWVRVLDEGLG